MRLYSGEPWTEEEKTIVEVISGVFPLEFQVEGGDWDDMLLVNPGPFVEHYCKIKPTMRFHSHNGLFELRIHFDKAAKVRADIEAARASLAELEAILRDLEQP
jgi:hypothetical protein